MYTKFYYVFLITIILISSCNENSEEILEVNTPVLKVSVSEIDFQNDKTTLYFNIENIGEGTLFWDIIEEFDWIITDKKWGSITQQADTLAVTVYRAGIPKGEIQEIISVKSNGGLHEIIVKLQIDEEVVMSGSFIDSRDDNTYKWVQIGNQTWMAENLAFKPEKGSLSFNYVEKYVEEFGRLYNMDALNQVCPEGWRIPTELEWEELMYFVISGRQNSPLMAYQTNSEECYMSIRCIKD